jgi:hypothetical protein
MVFRQSHWLFALDVCPLEVYLLYKDSTTCYNGQSALETNISNIKEQCYCLMPNDQFFSYIMAGTTYILMR